MSMNYTTLAASIIASTAVLLAAAPQDASKQPPTSAPSAAPKGDPHAGHDHKAAGASIHHAAPEFTLTGVDGKTYSLADFKGKTVVLEWFCSTCPVSASGSDSFWGSGSASATIDGVKAVDPTAVYLSINSTKDGHQGKSNATDGADSAAIVSKAGQSTPILMDSDGKVGRAYGAKTTPHIFIIDGTGSVVYIGAPTSDDGKTNYIVSAVTALKAGKPVEPATTKNKGCGIKYASKK
ncbi:MAG: redoxin domain-containing protein [Phycisphaerales bacterium]|nr:redoxin domain-containing protein [Phycisphaerales bacterium]